jgi:L-lactate dehydrogenase complex protein LldG
MHSSDAKQTILSKLRAATSAMPMRAKLPEYDLSAAVASPRLEDGNLEALFARNLAAVNGRLMRSVDELAHFLRAGGHLHGCCDPELAERLGPGLSTTGLTVETTYDRKRCDEYAFGITRGTGAIAESGTIIIDDHHTWSRLAALTPWVHVAVIHRGEIHRTIPDAIAALSDSPNIIWCTGPSKTADVEGILIEGVHGPGEQIALLLD